MHFIFRYFKKSFNSILVTCSMMCIFGSSLDDEPDGPTDPQHYIILTGFFDAAVLTSLIDIKVVPNAVIRIKTDYHLKLKEEKNAMTHIKSTEEVS